MKFRVNPRVLYTVVSAGIILLGTAAAIQYAKGNLRVTNSGVLRNAGLLAANSFPPGAEVIIDGKLVTATDDTLYLEPGQYEVEIVRDGYVPWRKTLTIERELVTQTNARLFPSAPSFTPLTFTGVTNISPSPDGQKIVYYSDAATAERKNGLYVLELSNNALSLQRGPRQISQDPAALDLANARFVWSPDSSEVMLLANGREVILQIDRMNDLASLPDVSFRRTQILSEWEEEMYVREREYLAQFPEEVIAVATSSAKNVYISPDKKRLLYTATSPAVIPDTIVPPLPATNKQPEQRELEPGGMYVYDREEDKNFRVGTEVPVENLVDKELLVENIALDIDELIAASPSAFSTLQATTSAKTATNFNTYHSPLFANTFQWFPDSKHLLFRTETEIKVIGYDATNETNIYSGPFAENFLYPWPDGNRLLILTAFSPDMPQNLYAIELK